MWWIGGSELSFILSSIFSSLCLLLFSPFLFCGDYFAFIPSLIVDAKLSIVELNFSSLEDSVKSWKYGCAKACSAEILLSAS